MRHFMTQSKFIIAVLAILAVIASSHAADTNHPVVAIYNSDWGLFSTNPEPAVITAVWADGRIVWSGTNGGAPYLQGSFATNKLDALLSSLDRKGAFTNQALTQPYFGPDSRFTTIAIDDGRRRLKMASWHELFEENTNLVATAHGIEPLAGRSREWVLQRQPSEYRSYRSTWSEIRQAVTAMIPKEGEPYDGDIRISTK